MVDDKRLEKYPDFDGTQNCAQVGMNICYVDNEELEGCSKRERLYFYATARKICDGCPFLDECFNWAIHHEKYGIWGGTTEKMRHDMRAKMGIKLVDPYLLAIGKH
jgi:hypothetical protein